MAPARLAFDKNLLVSGDADCVDLLYSSNGPVRRSAVVVKNFLFTSIVTATDAVTGSHRLFWMVMGFRSCLVGVSGL